MRNRGWRLKFDNKRSTWLWLTLLATLATTVPVIAARLANVIQSSAWRQVSDAVYDLPPEQDGSIVVTITGDRPIGLLVPNSDFLRVDANTFTTRFPWNWTEPRSVTFVDDLGDETPVTVAPGLAVPFTPLDHTLPVIHITCDSTALWDPEIGIYATGNYTNFLERGIDWERAARFEYYEPGAGVVVDQPIGLRIHGGYGRNYHQKGLRFYFDDYGSSDIYNFDFFGTGPTEFERLITRANRYDDFALNTNFAEGLFGDLGHLISRYQFVALYLNREYWGAYALRERLDDEFFRTTWHLDFGGLNLIKDGETKAGDATGWTNFQASFDNVADPEDEQWFRSVQETLDLASYIDWQLINMYCVSGDNGFSWNVALYQCGEHPWRIVMWDEDLLLHTADLNTDMFRFYTARDETEWNLYRAPTDGRGWNASDQRWLTMFRTLLGNSEFRSLFRARLEHLLGNSMSVAALTTRVDVLASEQRPEIPGHADRWEGFRTDWYDGNVVHAKQWLTDRRTIFMSQADVFFADFAIPPRVDDFAGLVINEFLTRNTTDARDETGIRDGWIEIYNRGTTTVDLTGAYLTDDLSATQQWEFPAVLLSAGDRLIVWCDNEVAQGPLHTSIRLSDNGGEIGLYSPQVFGNDLIDTHVYGVQTANVSEGRRTDGSDEWVSMSPATFDRANEGEQVVPSVVALGHSYPNPFNSTTSMDYSLAGPGRVQISVFDLRGRLIAVLVDEQSNGGTFQTQWHGRDRSGRQMPSGQYIARMIFGGETKTQSMTLVR